MKPPAAAMAETDVLWRFAMLLVIVHHIPGRVRLKLAAEDDAIPADVVADARRFSGLITAVPGIRSVKFNPLARSCVVEYDPGRIPPSTWHDLVAGTRSAGVEILLHALAAPLRAAACG